MWTAVTRKVFLIKSIFKSWSVPKIIMPFYAVAKGRTTGIFMTWPDCETQVKSFPGARYKKFNTVNEAQDFITANGGNSAPSNSKNSYKSLINVSKNLKRSFSISNNNQDKSSSAQSQQLSTSKLTTETNKSTGDGQDDAQFSDDSDDLNAILSKQMDDIEQRLKSFEKGVNKIIKTGARQTIFIDPPQNKRRKVSSDGQYEVDHDGFVQVYTDGACSGNGKTGARAGLGVFWGDSHPLNISEPVSGRATNNCGEIQAATKAIKQAVQNEIKKLSINTDSKFLINAVTKWMPGWKRKGWKLKSGEPVKNEIDFKDLDSVQHKLQIKWNYIEAHKGIHGNEMADKLAKDGAARYNR